MREFSFPVDDPRERAKVALAASDIDIIRAIEDGKPIPPSLKAYRASLRVMVREGGKPPKPPKP